MQKITLFYLSGCQYCNAAFHLMEELRNENPAYRSIQIIAIDEEKDAQLANQYDYYLVPTFYVGNRKVHEGEIGRASCRERVYVRV